MKLFLILLSLLFCNTVCADTINLHWLNEDGTTYENSTCVIDSDLILPSTPPTKYGYTFTGWKIGNYIPIEYLESTGTQYIDTGISGEGTWNIVAQSEETNKNRILVARGISGHVWFAATISGYWGVASDSSTLVPNTTKVNATIIFETDKISGTVNGRSFERTKSISVNWNNYMLLGYDNNYLFIGKLFSAKFIQNNILIRDFIPVLDENNIPCMFDKVESKFYYNQGTGNFIAGPTL